MQLHEIPAGLSHVVHLQVDSHSQHPGDNARCQREAGGVHEVKQQGDAGGVQCGGERHSHELLPAPTTPL